MMAFLKSLLGLGVSVQVPLGSGYSREKEESEVRSRIVAKMRGYKGIPYKLGAEVDPNSQVPPSQLDCSEATQIAYPKEPYLSRAMPDGACFQYDFCDLINTPEPGDLVFLKYWSNSSQRTVWHVGMLSEKQTVIHASASKGMVVEDTIATFTAHRGFVGWGRHPEFIKEVYGNHRKD